MFIKHELNKQPLNQRTETQTELPEKMTILCSFPTPNGPLHLGHLAGPYLAADIYARFLKQEQKAVIFICGLDQQQNRCGREPEKMLLYSQQIKASFDKLHFQADYLIETALNNRYHQLTKKLFFELYQKNIFISKLAKVFICADSGRYLADSEIVSSCPYCKSSLRGNNCENCYSYIENQSLVEPKAFNPELKLAQIEKEQLYFPLEQYLEPLKHFVHTCPANPSFKKHCLELLQRPLPQIPITQCFPWGISIQKNQHLCYYFEHLSRIVFAKTELNKASLASAKSPFLRFFGIDNIFMYGLFAPALIYAYNPALLQELGSNVNHYYLLGSKKFSTTKNNAVWADEFVERWETDLSRLYLAATRPEENTSLFNKKAFKDYIQRFKLQWRGLIKEILRELKLDFQDKTPEAGLWEQRQLAFYSKMHQLVKDAHSCLQADNLSLRDYVHQLFEFIKQIKNFRIKYLAYKKVKELDSTYRTAFALQLSSLHSLAILTWPLMPDFATRLYNNLGFKGQPIQPWSSLPLLPPGPSSGTL